MITVSSGGTSKDGMPTDTTLMTSPPFSIRTYVSDGSTSGKDADYAVAYRDFDYQGGQVSLQINYRVATQTDGPDNWGGANSVTDLRVRCYDASDSELAMYTYCLSCCRSNDHNDNYRTGNITYVLPPGVSRDGDGDIHLNPSTWYTLNVIPSNNLVVNWSAVKKIRVEMRVGGAFMHLHTIDEYWDYLVLTCGSIQYIDDIRSTPWTFTHENPLTDSTFISTFYPFTPSGPCTLFPLNPDPNPVISTVMQGGTVHRYYQIKDKDGKNVAARVKIVSGTSVIYNDSDENGLLKLNIDSDLLGQVGADPDNDGLINSQEFAFTTNPYNADTDGDLISGNLRRVLIHL